MSGSVVDTAAGVFTGAATGVGGLVGGAVGQFGDKLLDLFKAPKTPELKGPNALSSTPTQADASRVAIRKTLDEERAQFTTSSVLTSGAGLLDQPTTTSRTLLGA